MTLREVAPTAAAVLAVLMTGGCGGLPHPSSPAPALVQLRADVARLANASAAHNVAGAQAGVAAVNADLARAQATGVVSAATVTQIRALTAAVSADLAAAAVAVIAPRATPTVVRTTTAPTDVATVPPKPGKPGKGNGKDRG